MVSDHVALGASSSARGLAFNRSDSATPANQDPSTPWPSPYVQFSGSRSTNALDGSGDKVGAGFRTPCFSPTMFTDGVEGVAWVCAR